MVDEKPDKITSRNPFIIPEKMKKKEKVKNDYKSINASYWIWVFCLFATGTRRGVV